MKRNADDDPVKGDDSSKDNKKVIFEPTSTFSEALFLSPHIFCRCTSNLWYSLCSYFLQTKVDTGTEDEDEMKSFDIGDSLPSLTVKNEEDKDVDVASLASGKGVVIFLVPKADTRQLFNI